MTLRRLLPLAALALALALPALGGAVVPPKNCGSMTVKHKHYQVKADQISCKDGRDNARKFLRNGSKPRGYKCKDYASKKGRVDFYCNKGVKIFFAIRR